MNPSAREIMRSVIGSPIGLSSWMLVRAGAIPLRNGNAVTESPNHDTVIAPNATDTHMPTVTIIKNLRRVSGSWYLTRK